MNIKQFKVSIIVPAYNEENFLKRCLETLVNQTLQEIEIIIINDGSTDNTENICNIYANKYSGKVRVIHKDNEGVGLARNIGINASSGDYIAFVDADDWVELDMYEKMYNRALKTNAEIVICDVRKIFVETCMEKIEISLPEESDNINIGYYIKEGLNPAYSWNRLYKREIWEKYHFEKMVYEDLSLILTIQSNCQKIAYIQEALINYYKRPNSITTSYHNIRLLDIMTAYKQASYNVNSKYQPETVFCVAKRILINLETPGFSVYEADFIELINELSPLFLENNYIKNDNIVNKIYKYIGLITIPLRLFCNNINSKFSKISCWNNYTKNVQYIYLEHYEGYLNDIPICIKKELDTGNNNLLKYYLMLTYVYKYGGFSCEAEIGIKRPIGDIRSKKAVFIEYNKSYLNFFAGQKSLYIHKELLSLFNDNNMNLEKFIDLSSELITHFVMNNEDSLILYNKDNDIIA